MESFLWEMWQQLQHRARNREHCHPTDCLFLGLPPSISGVPLKKKADNGEEEDGASQSPSWSVEKWAVKCVSLFLSRPRNEKENEDSHHVSPRPRPRRLFGVLHLSAEGSSNGGEGGEQPTFDIQL